MTEKSATPQSTTGTSPAPRTGGFRPRRGRPRFIPKRKVCFFCANKNEVIDYKNTDKLRSYVSERGKIDPRRRTGTCARHQRELATAIKRARHLALLPFVADHVFPPAFGSSPKPAAKAAPAEETKAAVAKETPETKEAPVAEVKEPVEKKEEAVVEETAAEKTSEDSEKTES